MNYTFSSFRMLALLACLLGGTTQAHSETLRLNSGVGAPYFQPDKQGFLDILIPEVFRRIGTSAEAVRYAAAERAMINANTGVDDGVAMRIKGLEKTYPNLVRIEEKILDNDFVAYSSKAMPKTISFDSIKTYQVAYINGWKIFESGLPRETSVTTVQDAEQLFTLIINDRTDLVLFERWQGNYILRERNITAQALSPALATTEMYMYLHSKHSRLVEPAARALRDMKADGTYQRIAAQTLPGYIRK
jgi:polar amino acid transport system substrate-binding protein